MLLNMLSRAVKVNPMANIDFILTSDKSRLLFFSLSSSLSIFFFCCLSRESPWASLRFSTVERKIRGDLFFSRFMVKWNISSCIKDCNDIFFLVCIFFDKKASLQRTRTLILHSARMLIFPKKKWALQKKFNCNAPMSISRTHSGSHGLKVVFAIYSSQLTNYPKYIFNC